MQKHDRERKSGLDEEVDAMLDFEANEDVTVVPTFDNMGLKEPLLRGIYGFGTADVVLRVASVIPSYNLIQTQVSKSPRPFNSALLFPSCKSATLLHKHSQERVKLQHSRLEL